jgi:hypothetical protein
MRFLLIAAAHYAAVPQFFKPPNWLKNATKTRISDLARALRESAERGSSCEVVESKNET